MGAGHDAVAGELAARLRDRGHAALVRDVLGLLPPGVGPGLRGGYRATVRHAPRLYGSVYGAFLAQQSGPSPGSSPLAALAAHRLRRTAEQWRPDAVVSTFHLAAQLTGLLRRRGTLAAPAAVLVTDFAVHQGWLHEGNDLYLCVCGTAAHATRRGTGRPARTTGPVVPHGFFAAGADGGAAAAPWRAEFARRSPGAGPAVLLSAGAWGVGTGLFDTARLLAAHGWLPVLLCGRDEGLRRRAAAERGLLALGWVTDMPGLLASAHALVDNAAGQTAAQALAAGLPVVGYRPLPGHGAEGVRAMAAAGVSEPAGTPGELAAALTRLLPPSPVRAARVASGRALFGPDPAALVEELARTGRA